MENTETKDPEAIQPVKPVEEKKKVLTQVTFRVDPETVGKEVLEVLEYRKKRGLSKDLSDMFHQLWNQFKYEKNSRGHFKTGR